MFLLIIMALVLSCSRQGQQLRIGIIKPSIDHLPLSYGLEKGLIDNSIYQLVPFSSGWELQEAMIAGQVDVGIMPFTYAWNAASKGYPIRTVSFFERETDAIVVSSNISSIKDLHNARVGILKASTLDILMQDFARDSSFSYQPISFRSPNEMISALQAGIVDAIVIYVPLIQKLEGFQVFHWFGDAYPAHPCCDLSVNTEKLTEDKTLLLKKLLAALDEIIPSVNSTNKDLLDYVTKHYGLTTEQTIQALAHTVFATGLDEESKAFQRKMIKLAIDSAYQKQDLRDDQIYLELLK